MVVVGSRADAASPAAGLQPHWLVHRAADLLVLDKPAGLLSQPGLGPELADSLITRVRRHWPDAQLVHRLDRDTSGLILVALNADLHRDLSGLFAQRAVQKLYVAVVSGVPDAPEGCITLSIAKQQQRPPLYGPDPAGKPCRTDWRLLAACPDGSSSRLELRPLTGRSHQLRVHLSAMGHPILGDPLYGPPPLPAGPQRLQLHATSLAFRHPQSGEPLRFHSPCPF
jgi:tRNA pseudouridine32 synthase / 23S rRNA pseudouridine746 synthase